VIDTRRKGMRCRAVKLIRIHAGMITPSSQGTVAYETQNLGRRLIQVQWDTGVTTYVFPEEVEMTGANGSRAKMASPFASVDAGGRFHKLARRRKL
jgi:hypothetical protein